MRFSQVKIKDSELCLVFRFGKYVKHSFSLFSVLVVQNTPEFFGLTGTLKNINFVLLLPPVQHFLAFNMADFSNKFMR